MKQVIELKEHELLTSDSTVENGVYLKKSSFDLLEHMILSIEENNEEIEPFFKIANKKHIGKVIIAKNYVGLIQLRDGTQIQIYPKIYGHADIDVKRLFFKMLKALMNFPSKSFNEANLQIEKMNIFELFIKMYIDEIDRLVKKGLKSDYYTIENNIYIYKGKMLFNDQVKKNLVH